MSNKKLHKIEYETHGNYRTYFEKNHKCWYFMEKQAEGYSASEENGLIYNFKKPIDRKDTPQWYYRNEAVKKFIKDLCGIKINPEFFQKGYITVIPAPTSKARNSDGWNDRIDVVVEGWANCNPKIKVEYALDMLHDVPSSHQDGGSRKPSEIKRHLKFNGFKEEPSEVVIIVDDVYTTGGHFKAFREFILENEPRIKEVIGIFWALHMWNLPDVDELDF
jgi:hypothetical protein